MFRAIPFIVSLAALAACAGPTGEPPSLAKRPAEDIDPRLPVGTQDPATGQITLANEIRSLEEEAQTGIAAFDALEGQTGSAVAGAGEPNSESWVRAVEMLSRLEAARRPLVMALADLDALVTDRLDAGVWVSPGDRAAVDAAVARLAPIDTEQAARLERWTAQLQP